MTDYNLNGIEFIRCIVQSKNSFYNYWYLYPRFEDLVEKYIDINKTTFVLLDYPDESFRLEYKVKNIQDYKERMKNSTNRILSTKDGLYFKNFLPTSDIIELRYFKPGLFVSERLKQRIETSKITGLEIGDNPMLFKNVY